MKTKANPKEPNLSSSSGREALISLTEAICVKLEQDPDRILHTPDLFENIFIKFVVAIKSLCSPDPRDSDNNTSKGRKSGLVNAGVFGEADRESILGTFRLFIEQVEGNLNLSLSSGKKNNSTNGIDQVFQRERMNLPFGIMISSLIQLSDYFGVLDLSTTTAKRKENIQSGFNNEGLHHRNHNRNHNTSDSTDSGGKSTSAQTSRQTVVEALRVLTALISLLQQCPHSGRRLAGRYLPGMSVHLCALLTTAGEGSLGGKVMCAGLGCLCALLRLCVGDGVFGGEHDGDKQKKCKSMSGDNERKRMEIILKMKNIKMLDQTQKGGSVEGEQGRDGTGGEADPKKGPLGDGNDEAWFCESKARLVPLLLKVLCRLRAEDSPQTRKGVADFAGFLLKECSMLMQGSVNLVIETLIILREDEFDIVVESATVGLATIYADRSRLGMDAQIAAIGKGLIDSFEGVMRGISSRIKVEQKRNNAFIGSDGELSSELGKFLLSQQESEGLATFCNDEQLIQRVKLSLGYLKLMDAESVRELVEEGRDDDYNFNLIMKTMLTCLEMSSSPNCRDNLRLLQKGNPFASVSSYDKLVEDVEDGGLVLSSNAGLRKVFAYFDNEKVLELLINIGELLGSKLHPNQLIWYLVNHISSASGRYAKQASFMLTCCIEGIENQIRLSVEEHNGLKANGGDVKDYVEWARTSLRPVIFDLLDLKCWNETSWSIASKAVPEKTQSLLTGMKGNVLLVEVQERKEENPIDSISVVENNISNILLSCLVMDCLRSFSSLTCMKEFAVLGSGDVNSESDEKYFRLLFLQNALYGILLRASSSNDAIARHAFSSLTTLSTSCSYCSIADMVNDNMDYLVACICAELMRVNSWENSGRDCKIEAISVLTVVVRYCDARVLSIFQALSNSIGTVLDSNPKLYGSAVIFLYSVLLRRIAEWYCSQDGSEMKQTTTEGCVSRNLDASASLRRIKKVAMLYADSIRHALGDFADGEDTSKNCFDSIPCSVETGEEAQREEEAVHVDYHLNLTQEVVEKSLRFGNDLNPLVRMLVLDVIRSGVYVMSISTKDEYETERIRLHMESLCHQLIHKVWGYIVDRVADIDKRVQQNCLQLLTHVLRLSLKDGSQGTEGMLKFMAQRVRGEMWPIVHAILISKPDANDYAATLDPNTHSYRFSQYFKSLSAAFELLIEMCSSYTVPPKPHSVKCAIDEGENTCTDAHTYLSDMDFFYTDYDKTHTSLIEEEADPWLIRSIAITCAPYLKCAPKGCFQSNVNGDGFTKFCTEVCGQADGEYSRTEKEKENLPSRSDMSSPTSSSDTKSSWQFPDVDVHCPGVSGGSILEANAKRALYRLWCIDGPGTHYWLRQYFATQ
eukprot:Nk52_evm30s2152 gene=Nk52_evmTU30s2152